MANDDGFVPFDRRLSEHFSVAEFVASEVAARRGIDNRLPAALLDNAMLTAAMLEKIRAFLWQEVGWECPIIITSGYRCQELNEAVGSHPGSDHVRAMAADWCAPLAGSPKQIAAMLLPKLDELGIGQLILEYPNSPRSWLHTSVKTALAAGNRALALINRGSYVPLRSYLA